MLAPGLSRSGLGGPVAPLLLPAEADCPADFCTRTAQLQNSVGDDIVVPGPPVMWLTQLPQLRQEKGPLPRLPHAPLWWAGSEWREFPETSAAPHSQMHSAYEPRRFQPPRLCGGMLRLVETPGEAGPDDRVLPMGVLQSGVFRAMRAMLCQRTMHGQAEGELWARPTLEGGQWRRCPHQFIFQLALTEAFEISGGDMYAFLFRSGGGSAGGLDTVMLYSVVHNEWLPLERDARKWAPLKAWNLESTPEGIMLLAPVSRDLVQRGGETDMHSALYYLGARGEIVSHHFPCHPLRLTVQRYARHILFVKDFDEHPLDHEDACLDDNWDPSYPGIAGWMLVAEDIAVPPLPVHLPSVEQGWGGAGSSWSLVLSRGNMEEVAPSRALRHDTAPRIYLLEAGAMLRLWVSRRVDESVDKVLQRVTLDGTDLVRHSFGFSEVLGSSIELHQNSIDAFGAWSLWSADMEHAARVALQSRKLSFWRCSVIFAGEKQDLQSSMPHAHRMTTESDPWLSQVQTFPLHRGWRRCDFSPADVTGCFVASGLPIFPALRWGEADFSRAEGHWLHPVARDSAYVHAEG